MPDGVEVAVDFPADLPPALADADQLRIVFGNLIRNAGDAMPHGRPADDRRPPDRTIGLEVAVTDTGVGIAPEDLARIMEPLYSTKARGLGLGLAIVADDPR